MANESNCIFKANGEAEAQQAKAFLEARGIPCQFRGETLRTTYGFTLNGLGVVEIHVPDSYVEQARELLQQVEAGALTLESD